MNENHVALIASLLSVLGVIVGFMKVYILTPVQIDDLQKRVKELETGKTSDHVLLVRVEEQLKSLRRDLNRVIPGMPHEDT